MGPSARDVSTLVREALRVEVKDFIRLVDEVTSRLANEDGRVGELQVKGRLVHVPPGGELVVVGDLHGDLESLQHVLEESGFIEKCRRGRDIYVVFLGDYGDRGAYSPEVYYVVLSLKEMFPERVVLLRGNHEGPEDLLPYPHDLPDHLHRKFGRDGIDAYRKIRPLFDQLYNAALIGNTFVLVHGGVPSRAKSIDDVAYAHERHPAEPHLEEILWSDPVEGLEGTYPSPRGAGLIFGPDVTQRFLEMLNASVLVRGHEPSELGYKVNHGGMVLTLFSRKGPPYYNRSGAYLHLEVFREVRSVEEILDCIRLF